MRLWLLSALRICLLMLPLAGATFCGGEDGPTGSSGNPQLNITNESNHSVWYVRVRDCGAQAWGGDLLASDIIFPGSGQSFAVTPGCHDLKLETDPDLRGELIWSNLTFAPGQVVSQTVTSWSYSSQAQVGRPQQVALKVPSRLEDFSRTSLAP